ncbi:MAG: BrnT family toxin [Longimicrobiales bacterium]
MNLEWDRAKAAADRLKHRVSFADAIGVFYDPTALTVADNHRGEERFATVGFDSFGRLLVVVYCWRGNAIRIISAQGDAP